MPRTLRASNPAPSANLCVSAMASSTVHVIHSPWMRSRTCHHVARQNHSERGLKTIVTVRWFTWSFCTVDRTAGRRGGWKARSAVMSDCS